MGSEMCIRDRRGCGGGWLAQLDGALPAREARSMGSAVRCLGVRGDGGRSVMPSERRGGCGDGSAVGRLQVELPCCRSLANGAWRGEC